MARRKIDDTEIKPRRLDVLSSLPDISGSQGIIGDASEPLDDFLFDSGELERSSRKAMGAIGILDNLVLSGKITTEEAADKKIPFNQQVERAARVNARRQAVVQNGEFLIAAVDDAKLNTEQSTLDVEQAEASVTAIEDRIAQAGDNVNAIASLRPQLAQADERLRAARQGASEAAVEFKTARANRLASLGSKGDVGPAGVTGTTGDDIHAEFEATSRRLEAERTPEEQAVFDAARAEATGDPLDPMAEVRKKAIDDYERLSKAYRAAAITERGKRLFGDQYERPGSEENAPAGGGRVVLPDGRIIVQGARTEGGFFETGTRAGGGPAIADVTASTELNIIRNPEARARREAELNLISLLAKERKAQGIEPSEADKRSIRIKGRADIKAAKTHAEKKEIVEDMRAALKGEKTQRVKDKERVAAFDRFEATGVTQSEELLDLDAEHNTKLNATIERIKRELPNARGKKAAKLVKEFERVSARLKKNLTAQSKVIEKRLKTERKVAKIKQKESAERLQIAKDTQKRVEEAREQAIDDKNQAAIVAGDKAVADAEKKVAEAEKEDTDLKEKETKAVEKKLRADAALRLEAVDLKAIDEQIESAEDSIKPLATAALKLQEIDPTGVTPAFEANATALRTANDALVDLQTQRTALRKRISEIKTRAQIVNGGFAPSPPLPKVKGDPITPEVIQAYFRFYGDSTIAQRAAITDGWKIPD